MNLQNKRGLSLVFILLFIFACFFLIIFLGLAMFSFSQVNSILNQDVDIGQVNLQDVNNQTFGQISTGFVDNGDTLGIVMIFGMVLFMMLNGFILGRDHPKLFLIIDIFILFFAFILAVYISQTFETFINASSVLSVYIDDLPKSSAFILNLPVYVSIIGILVMILTYAGINKKEENVNVAEVYTE